MSRLTKRKREIVNRIGKAKTSSLQEAIEVLKACPPVKFDQSLDISFKLGIDSRKSDQNVRGAVSLPHGTGRAVRVVVLAKGDAIREAELAGADVVGSDELIQKIGSGWTDFDVLITTPDMMREVGRLGKILGPRGLMPTPKAGTVTTNVGKAVLEVKAGKIEFKADRQGVVNAAFGKLSFATNDLIQNLLALFQALSRAKPATVKGQYVKSVVVSSTMGPGMRLDPNELETFSKG